MKENEISSSRIYKLNQEGKERLTRPVGTAAASAAALLLPGKCWAHRRRRVEGLMMEKLMTAAHRNAMGRLSRSLFSPARNAARKMRAGQAGAERSTVKAALIVSHLLPFSLSACAVCVCID